MKTIDIIHIEDNHHITEALGELFKRRKISYHAVSSSEELDEVLKEAEAKVYVIDDSFPGMSSGSIGKNYLSAIESVQERNSSAPIILFASKDLSDTAKIIGIDYINKNERISGLAHKIYEILGYFSKKHSRT